MNIKIAPSILSADFANLQQEITMIDQAGADYIHLDIMDGHFVDNITFGAPIINKLRPYTKKVFDTHLMIENAHKYIESFAKAGSDIITFHYEATSEPQKIAEEIKHYGCKAGISIKPSTSEKVLDDLYPYFDQILVMTVEPGFGGQSFLDSQLPKIEYIRNKISQCNKDIDLEVDGGINNLTKDKVINAGANILVSGSYIFGHSSYQEAISSLRQ